MDIEYQIVRSKSRKKSASLKVLPSGEVQVRAPVYMRDDFIANFVNANEDWIESQRLKIIKTKPKEVVENELWPYLGELYIIKLVSTRLRPRIEISEQFIIVRINSQTNLALRRKLIIEWYKKQARTLIVDLVKKYASILGEQYGLIRLKDTTSRWGSCSSEGNLNFNWRLVLAPQRVLEYVVIHEVCHLRYQHHKTSFWRLVETLDREYRNSRTYLKHHGWKLNI